MSREKCGNSFSRGKETATVLSITMFTINGQATIAIDGSTELKAERQGTNPQSDCWYAFSSTLIFPIDIGNI